MEVLSILPSTHYPLYDFDLRATHARTLLPAALASVSFGFVLVRVRVRTNTNPNGTEANSAGRSGNARALRKQSKCGMIQEGEGHWPNPPEICKKRNIFETGPEGPKLED